MSTIHSLNLKGQIDKLWEQFWTGGITNPLTVIEQISFLMFARLLDIQETLNERKALRLKKPFKQLFTEQQQSLRGLMASSEHRVILSA